MKTKEDIIKEAPTITIMGGVDGKLAGCCASCPWWTNDPAKGRVDPGTKTAVCPKCGGSLLACPLDELIEGVELGGTENFEAFLKNFSDNSL